MSDEPVLLDTNILVYALDPAAPHHRACRDVLLTARSPGAGLCVVPQILSEFYAIETSPKRTHQPHEPHEAIDAIERILEYPGIKLLSVPDSLVKRWLSLLRRHAVKGQRVFDLQLIATMLANGVHRIYTFDSKDFAVFDEITVLTPPEMRSDDSLVPPTQEPS